MILIIIKKYLCIYLSNFCPRTITTSFTFPTLFWIFILFYYRCFRKCLNIILLCDFLRPSWIIRNLSFVYVIDWSIQRNIIFWTLICKCYFITIITVHTFRTTTIISTIPTHKHIVITSFILRSMMNISCITRWNRWISILKSLYMIKLIYTF